MVHVDALPGTPGHHRPMAEIVDQAVNEALVYQNNQVDAIMLENMHDLPYLNQNVGPEIIAAMSVVAAAVREAVVLPLGIQILAGANKQALAVAKAADLDFIRAEGFVFSHIADEGLMNSCAGELLRYRRYIEAENVAVFSDLKKKHAAHAITGDVSMAETVQAALFFKTDGVIITGTSTGATASPEDVKMAFEASRSVPVLIGSGVNDENLKIYWPYADGFIVGSSLKYDGDWEKPVDAHRVRTFMKRVNDLRNQ